MRSALCGVSLLALTFSVPALADCADEVAALEQEMEAEVTAPAAGPDAEAGATTADQAAGSGQGEDQVTEAPEEEVEEMVEEGVTVEEGGEPTTFAGTGPSEPREAWQHEAPPEHPGVEYLARAKEHLEQGDEQACLDEVASAREEMAQAQDQ